MQFKNWPFKKDEKVVLYWMTSPRKNVSGWVMDAVFKRQSGFSPRILRVEVPWGTLPYLRIGRTYYDKGRLDDTSTRGLESKLILLREHRGKLMPAHAMPRELRSFYGDTQLAGEMVWAIADGYKTYYFPCLELVRAFLASSVYMTNQLFFPNAIEDIVSEEGVTENALNMVLNSRIPTTIANNSTAFHIAWLRHNPTARKMWEGILANQRRKARDGGWPNLEAALQSGVPLECEMPNDTKYVITFRGFYSGDHWLVQEIISVDGFDIPFEEVSYSHPLLEMMRFEDEGENTSRTKPKMIGTGQEDEMDNLGGPAKATSFQPRVVVPAVEFLAKKKIKIKPIFRQTRTAKRNQGKGQTKNWCPTHQVTTQDSQYGGFLHPIEVRGISFVDFDKMSMENQNGLKEFVDSIIILSEQQPAWNLDVKFVLVPEGIRISKYPSGERRMCVVVKIERVAKGPIWLVELARPDQWKISTLLLGGSSLENPTENLKKWLSTDGHWNICALKEALCPSIRMVRHTNAGIKFRMENLKQKIRMID